MYCWIQGTLVLCCSLAIYVGVASPAENRPSVVDVGSQPYRLIVWQGGLIFI